MCIPLRRWFEIHTPCELPDKAEWTQSSERPSLYARLKSRAVRQTPSPNGFSSVRDHSCCHDPPFRVSAINVGVASMSEDGCETTGMFHDNMWVELQTIDLIACSGPHVVAAVQTCHPLMTL